MQIEMSRKLFHPEDPVHNKPTSPSAVNCANFLAHMPLIELSKESQHMVEGRPIRVLDVP